MGFYDYWLDFRDRCLTSQPFHDFAIRFAPTRPVFRKRQSEAFDLVSGFVYSQVLFACVELGLLSGERLKSPGASISELSASSGLDEDAMRRLAEAAASLRLFEERNGRYRLGDLGAALAINKGALAMIRHHAALYKDLADPVALLRSGRQETHLSRYWDYARSLDPASASAEDVAQYSELMSASQDPVASEVLATFDFSPHQRLMDLGGGQGTFLNRVADEVPDLELLLFDLPEVVERARKAQQSGAINPRIGFEAGSFFDPPLPKGADVISLVRILHDHDDGPVEALLGAAHAALPSGGVLLIAEPMATGGHASRISHAYFNFYLFAMGSGRPRSPAELIATLERSGFTDCELKKSRSPFTTSILVARKP